MRKHTRGWHQCWSWPCIHDMYIARCPFISYVQICEFQKNNLFFWCHTKKKHLQWWQSNCWNWKLLELPTICHCEYKYWWSTSTLASPSSHNPLNYGSTRLIITKVSFSQLLLSHQRVSRSLTRVARITKASNPPPWVCFRKCNNNRKDLSCI